MFLLLYVTVYITCTWWWLWFGYSGRKWYYFTIIDSFCLFYKTNTSNYDFITLCDCVNYMYMVMIMIWIRMKGVSDIIYYHWFFLLILIKLTNITMFLLLYVTVYGICTWWWLWFDIQHVSDIIFLSLIVFVSFYKTNTSNYVSFTLCDRVCYMYMMMIVIWYSASKWYYFTIIDSFCLF